VSLAVLDWRRRVFALYAEVRSTDDPAAAHRRWCEVRDDLFAHHPASPVPAERRSAFAGLDVAPYDPAFRFEVPLEPPLEPAHLDVPTGTDGVVPFERIGVVGLGDLGRLDVWWVASYGGGVFLPVKDGLAGRATYGGGRYVLDTVKGADLGGGGERPLVVDLNFAYNPSCAYDPEWACPLAPPGNVLFSPVPVGERTFS
jgi:uncharacterized protein (DUF1684 family)